jgi:hypothetical protein
MDRAPVGAAECQSGQTPQTALPAHDFEATSDMSRRPRASAWQLASATLDWPFLAFLLTCFAGVIGIVYLSKLGQGLWEDGYFVKRFAYNFWHHQSFSWNVADGPVYGMTSQTLQLLGTALYGLFPRHLVLALKAALCASLFFTLPALLRAVGQDQAPSAAPEHEAPALRERAVALLPGVVGLASAPILESTLTGLETVTGLMMVAISLGCVVRAKGGLRHRLGVVASVVAVYLTRPDAVLIPLVLLGARWLLAASGRARGLQAGAESRELKTLTWTLSSVALCLGALLVSFHLYYGTALPLPFYVKTRGLTAQPADYIVYFVDEKAKNAAHAAFFALPFVYIALHQRSRLVISLLLAGCIFCGYHYFATIETMGYLARFYLPGLIPIFIAAGVAYRTYQLRRIGFVSGLVFALQAAACIALKRFDTAPPAEMFYVPALLASGILLLGPAGYNPCNALAIGLCLVGGALQNYPLYPPSFAEDEALLTSQVRRRPVFRGLVQLRNIDPKVIYHTDMGAPGLLFPEAKVVDLDGLLNEDITLRGAHFEELCQKDRPEAVFVPNLGYRQLREEVLSSQCLKDYRRMTPTRGAPLYVRSDLVARYRGD